MSINDRYSRFVRDSFKRESLNRANQNDLQNVKSLRIAPNSRSYVDQRAKTEEKRMYAEAVRKAGKTAQDKFAEIGFDTIRDVMKILNGGK